MESLDCFPGELLSQDFESCFIESEPLTSLVAECLPRELRSRDFEALYIKFQPLDIDMLSVQLNLKMPLDFWLLQSKIDVSVTSGVNLIFCQRLYVAVATCFGVSPTAVVSFLG